MQAFNKSWKQTVLCPSLYTASIVLLSEGRSDEWEIKSRWNDTQQHGWISEALSWVKEASLKRLHTVWLHLYVILEKTHNSDGEQINGSQGQVWEESVTITGQQKGIWGDDGASGGYTNLYLSLKTQNSKKKRRKGGREGEMIAQVRSATKWDLQTDQKLGQL